MLRKEPGLWSQKAWVSDSSIAMYCSNDLGKNNVSFVTVYVFKVGSGGGE